MMNAKTKRHIEARFLKSCSNVEQLPDKKWAEFAFIGRSNVGKSSLINMLTGTKNLALTSSTPGKTQLINYFEVNDRFFLVDLPGYGYAKRSKVIRDSWDDLISTYILGRSYLLNTYVLVDSRIKPQMLDLLFMKNMAFNERPFTIVFTKADKLKPDVLKNHIENYKETLLEEWVELPEMIVTSAVTNAGREALLDHILAIRKLFPSGDKS